MKYIFNLRSIPASELEKCGGKATSLSLMMQNLKMNIPSGYVITADAFCDGKIKDEAKSDLNDMIRSLDRTKTYAVRSSAIGEDGAGNSAQSSAQPVCGGSVCSTGAHAGRQEC